MGGFPSFWISEFLSFRVSKLPNFRVSKFPSFQRREGGRTNGRPGTDHVISGQMRGLKKRIGWRKHTNRQTDKQKTDGHCDSMTESAQWGQFSENILCLREHLNGIWKKLWAIYLLQSKNKSSMIHIKWSIGCQWLLQEMWHEDTDWHSLHRQDVRPASIGDGRTGSNQLQERWHGHADLHPLHGQDVRPASISSGLTQGAF